MEKLRIIAEIDEDIVNILFAESADEISREDSSIGIPYDN